MKELLEAQKHMILATASFMSEEMRSVYFKEHTITDADYEAYLIKSKKDQLGVTLK